MNLTFIGACAFLLFVSEPAAVRQGLRIAQNQRPIEGDAAIEELLRIQAGRKKPELSNEDKESIRKATGLSAEQFLALSQKAFATIEEELGPMREKIQREQYTVEAISPDGKRKNVTIEIEDTRNLRDIGAEESKAKAVEVLSSDATQVILPGGAVKGVVLDTSKTFMRVYEGEEAQKLAMELRMIVAAKGAEWREATNGPTCNAIAIRGLDFVRGLHQNTNSSYDDTGFWVVSDGQRTEVCEYRMTTESSSERLGVGRLASKQFEYVSGLHRGVAPAFRMKGTGDGTRAQMDGEYQIAGANIHWAWKQGVLPKNCALKENVSLGCQVIAADIPSFEHFVVNYLAGKGIRGFLYTIADGSEAAVLDISMQNKGKRSIIVRGIPRS